MDENQLRDVANALVRLTGQSKNSAALKAGVSPSNASSWLTGEDRKLSLESQLILLASLGVSYGLLRRDMTHNWIIGNNAADARLVLSLTDGNASDPSRGIDDSMIRIEEPDDAALPGRVIVSSLLGGLGVSPVVINITRPLMMERPLPLSELLRIGHAPRKPDPAESFANRGLKTVHKSIVYINDIQEKHNIEDDGILDELDGMAMELIKMVADEIADGEPGNSYVLDPAPGGSPDTRFFVPGSCGLKDGADEDVDPKPPMPFLRQ